MAEELTILERLQALEDKVDSPVRRAYYQQFGESKYADAEFLNLLRDALIDIYENGGGSGGGGTINQDNKTIVKRLSVRDNTIATAVEKINTAAAFEITEIESFLFVIHVREFGQSALVYKYQLVNKGKGIYGTGGTQLATTDLELLYATPPTVADYEDPTTVTINFGVLAGQTISQWLNGRSPSITLQPQDAGYTLFKGTVDGVVTSYLFIGIAGRYGTGYLISAMTDFEKLSGTSTTLVLGETDDKAYYGGKGKTAYDHSQASGNPHGTTISQVTGAILALAAKADLVSGKVPAEQLPSYVDDVMEYANLASFPTPGESGKLYIAVNTNLVYRWGGSSYVVTSSSLALGETSTTAYRGDRGKAAYDHSQDGTVHVTPTQKTAWDNKLNAGANAGLAGASVRVPIVNADGTLSVTELLKWIASNRELVIGALGSPGRLNVFSNTFKLAVQDNISSGQATIEFNSNQDDALSFKDKAGNIYQTFRTVNGNTCVILKQREIYDEGVFYPLAKSQAAITSNGGGVKVYAVNSIGALFTIPFATDTMAAVFEVSFVAKNATASQVIAAKFKAAVKRVGGAISITPQTIEVLSNNASTPGFAIGLEAVNNNLQLFFMPQSTDNTSYTGAFHEIKYTVN